MHGMVSNSLWIVILGIICVGQYLLVQFGGHALNSHLDGLTWDQWLICIVLGLGGLIVNSLINLFPVDENVRRGPQADDASNQPTRFKALQNENSDHDYRTIPTELHSFNRQNGAATMDKVICRTADYGNIKGSRRKNRTVSRHSIISRSFESLRQPLVGSEESRFLNEIRLPFRQEERPSYSAPTLGVAVPTP